MSEAVARERTSDEYEEMSKSQKHSRMSREGSRGPVRTKETSRDTAVNPRNPRAKASLDEMEREEQGRWI